MQLPGSSFRTRSTDHVRNRANAVDDGQRASPGGARDRRVFALIPTTTGANAKPLSGASTARRAAAYRAHIERLPTAVRTRVIGRSWHAGCPVPLRDLR